MKVWAMCFISWTGCVCDDSWVLLHCDNFNARASTNAKCVVSEGKAFLRFLPAQEMESVQILDTGVGRIVRTTSCQL